MEKVHEQAEVARKGTYCHKKLCLFVTLNVKWGNEKTTVAEGSCKCRGKLPFK